MDKSHEVNAFCNGIVVGINLYQQKVVTAQKNNEAIKIDGVMGTSIVGQAWIIR